MQTNRVEMNVDFVVFQVDMEVTDDGMAISTARVRCERTIPVRGSGDIFQRSSVIVTKRIQVDLKVSTYRRRLWMAIRGVRTTLSDDQNGEADHNEGPLTKSDTLVLYSKFKQMVEMNKTVYRSSNWPPNLVEKVGVGQWWIHKFLKGGRKTVCQTRRHLSQMHVLKYYTSCTVKATYWKKANREDSQPF